MEDLICWESRYISRATGLSLFARENISRGQLVLRETLGINPNPNTKDARPPAYKSTSAESLVIGGFNPTTYSLSQIVFGIGSGRQPLDKGSHPVVIGTSKVNHSCVPNMFRLDFWSDTGGLEVHFHAIRDIGAGEELTVSYFDSVHELLLEEQVSIRRSLIGDTFGFWCSCERCVRQSRLRPKSPTDRWDVDCWFGDAEASGYPCFLAYQYSLVEDWRCKNEASGGLVKSRASVSRWRSMAEKLKQIMTTGG